MCTITIMVLTVTPNMCSSIIVSSTVVIHKQLSVKLDMVCTLLFQHCFPFIYIVTMASSSVSQEDVENDFELSSRRSRIRTARARTVNPTSRVGMYLSTLIFCCL